MIQHRCWQPRSHDPHTWNDGTEDRHCNGRPFASVAVSPDAPTRPETPETPVPDQQDGSGALPRFSIRADYITGCVAVLFDLDAIPELKRHPLFAREVDALTAAAVALEQDIEDEILRRRDRQILGGLR